MEQQVKQAASSEQMKAWLKQYRAYIGQAMSKEEHQLRVSRMVTYCADLDDCVLAALGKDKFFYQAWIKYANRVADTEDVFDYMLEKQIGADFASVYIQIAGYIESVVKDVRKAELTLRNGQTHLAKSTQLKKELSKLEKEYAKFDKRVQEDAKKVNSVLRKKVQGPVTKSRRRYEEYTKIQSHHEKELDRTLIGQKTTKGAFTESQKFIGGVPIYVDKNVRDKVIPRGKQQVELLFTGVKRLDKYLPVGEENFYVEDVRQARELERKKAKDCAHVSFFDERPQLKINSSFVPFDKDLMKEQQAGKARMFRTSDYQEVESTNICTHTRPSFNTNQTGFLNHTDFQRSTSNKIAQKSTISQKLKILPNTVSQPATTIISTGDEPSDFPSFRPSHVLF